MKRVGVRKEKKSIDDKLTEKTKKLIKSSAEIKRKMFKKNKYYNKIIKKKVQKSAQI